MSKDEILRLLREIGADCGRDLSFRTFRARSGLKEKQVVGHTSSPSRRHREVRLDLPDRTDFVHSIATDDPRGIEAYWHSRFADRGIRETEFFELSAAEVAAFKKRSFQ